MKKVLKKPNNSAGFTLAETLIAVVILVMITATAMPAAVSAYRNAVDAANAQVLLSTTVNALRSELSTAWNVDVNADGTTITYHSADTGDKSVITVENSTIMLEEYYTRKESPDWWGSSGELPENSENLPELKRSLVSDAMRQTTRDSGERMTVKYTGVTSVKSANGKYIEYIKIDGLAVERDNKVLAKMPDAGLLIRVMSAESEASGG